MATSKVAVTAGSGTNLATYSVTEDSTTKEISRVSLNGTDGAAVTVSSGTLLVKPSSVTGVTLSSNPTVSPSSVWSVSLSSNPTVSPSSVWTFTLSSNPTVIPSSVQGVTLSSAVQISSGTITLSSNPTVSPSSVWTTTLSSNPTVIASSVWTVSLSSQITVLLSSVSPGVDYNIGAGEYETVAASQTNQSLGSSAGRVGDYLSGLLVVPTNTDPGNILIADSTATQITVFAGGSSSVSNLVPFFIPLGMISVSSGWKVTTGLNVSVIGIGNFT